MISKGLAPATKPARIFSNKSPNGNVCTSTVPPVLSPHSFQWFSIGLAICGPVCVATTRLTPLHWAVPIPFGKRSVVSAWKVVTSPAAGASVAAVVGASVAAVVGASVAAVVGASVCAGACVCAGAGVAVGAGAPHPARSENTMSIAIMLVNLLFIFSLLRKLGDL